MPITHSREVLTGSRLKAQGPLDAKAVVPTIVDRDAIPTIERYHLMRVDVQDTGAQYQLKNAGDLSVWTEQTTSGITEAPLDGEAYVRQSGSWAISPESGWLVSGTTTLDNTNDVLINKPAVLGLEANSVIIRGAGDRTAAGRGYYTSELILSNDGDSWEGNFIKLSSSQTIDGDTEAFILSESGDEVNIYTRDGADYTSVSVGSTSFGITGGWGGNFSSSTFSQQGILLHASLNNSNSIQIRDDSLRGMWYNDDYSALGAIFGDRWIPDKGYVDSVAGGGGGTPGGADTEIQFNDNGVFGGSPVLTFAADTLSINDSALANTINLNAISGISILGTTGNNTVLLRGPSVGLLQLLDNAGTAIIEMDAGDPSQAADFNATTSIVLPKGTSAERPAVLVASMIRFNTDLTTFEGYDGTSWLDLAGGGGGTPGGADTQIQFNDNGVFGGSERIVAVPSSYKIRIRDSVNNSQFADLNLTGLDIGNSLYAILSKFSSDSGSNEGLIELYHQGNKKIALHALSHTSAQFHSYIDVSSLGIGTNTPNQDIRLDIVGTTAITLPKGTTAERPTTPVSSMIRFNTDNVEFEGHDGTVWGPLGGSTGGGGGTEVTAMFDSDLDIVRDTYMFGAAEFTSINYDIAALNSVTIETSTDFINWTIQATLIALNIFTQAQTGSSYYIRLTANYIAGVTHTTGAQLTYIR